MNTQKIYSIIITAMLLVGCGNLPNQQSTITDKWSFKGKLSLRQAQHAQMMSISWEQVAEHSHIFLSNPLASQSLIIDGVPGEYVLTDQDGNTQRVQQIEDLQYGGVPIPFGELKYWVKAKPAPNLPAEAIVYSKHGKIQAFKQVGWQINIQEYGDSGHNVPKKIVLTQDDMVIKLVIGAWG